MMKTLAVTMVALTVAMSVFAHKKGPEYLKARRNGGELRMIVSAVDDDGNAVSNASVKVLMGMNFRERAYFVDGMTDAQGQFVIEGKTTGNEVEIGVTKDGYYKASKKLCLVKMGSEYEVRNGKWQPWGMVLELPMRRVVNPIELIALHDGIQVPATNTWIGFDMEKKDWIASGRGGEIPDFEVMVQWDGRPMATLEFAQMDIRFVGNGAGFYFADKTIGSAFAGVYNADTSHVFQTEFTCRAMRKNGVFSDSGVPKGKLMVVRSRCKLDEKGNIREANYSMIRTLFIEGGWKGKAVATVNYRFNPTPNDTNLEPK
ncbi:MAG: carboxypeptidase regulatory-like domain-containing protein [Kiritimatiellae bacterium]|nr:carboxypeptidase regulatory-like domain-containing protein [Kiritimatiellia bacterium]